MSIRQSFAPSVAGRRALAALTAGVLLGALGMVAATPASPAGATSSNSSGCGASSPGTTTLTMSVHGFTRTVLVHVPLGSSNSTPSALVLNLHGSGSTAVAQRAFSAMNRTSDVDHFIVAYPQGLIADGAGFDWNVPGVTLTGNRPVPANAANDVSFLTSLVGILEGKYCVDTNEVYATGFSGGARMVSQLACDDSRIFAAVAPVSGLRRPSPCPTSRAVPMLAFHGSLDKIDPYAGHGEKYWTYSVSTAAKDWAQQDACSTKPTTTAPEPGVKLVAYGHCQGGAVVDLYEVMGEGHEWPGGPTLPAGYVDVLGPQSNALSANAVMWAFFAAHPL